MAEEQQERKRYVVGAVKIPFAQRDLAHRVITDDDDRNFLDVIGADEPDDHHEFPVGSNTTYAVDLTEAEAEEFRAASNARYVEEDQRTWPVGTVTPGPAGDPGPIARPAASGVPRASTLNWMECNFGAFPEWHGRDVNVAILDQGTTAAVRSVMGFTLVARAYFGGTPAGGTELFPDPNDPSGYFSHGCLTSSEGVPEGGKLIDAIVIDSSGSSSGSMMSAGARWAIQSYGAKVLNYSFGVPGGGGASSVYTDLFTWMQSYDAHIYIAAGNDSLNLIDYPAAYCTSYSNVHSTAAFDETTGAIADFSNYSVNVNGVAPGVNVAGLNPSGQLVQTSGTSMSTPHSASLCARIQTGGRFTAAQAAQALDNNTRNTGYSATYQGHGAFSMKKALVALGGIGSPVIREVVSANAFATSISVTLGAGTQVGDRVVMFHQNDFGAYGQAGTSLTGPDTTAFKIGVDAGTNNSHIYCYTAVIDQAGSQTITANNPAQYSCTLHAYVLKQCYSYDDGGAIVDTSINTQQSTPDFTAFSSDCMFILACATKPSATYTAPSGLVKQTEQSSFANTTCMTATKTLTASGMTSTGYAGLSATPSGNNPSLAVTVSGGTIPAATNTAPTANAGTDQTVVSGATVSLHGTASDAEGLAASPYAWTVANAAGTGLTNSSITNRLTANPSFTAPTVTANAAITLRLTVTDAGGLTATDDVNVTVTPSTTGGGGGGGGTPGGPTVVAWVETHGNITGSGSLTTGSFTPAVGELLVLKAWSSPGDNDVTSVSGGGLTWTRRAHAKTNGVVAFYTATATSATAMTATATFTQDAGAFFTDHAAGLVVERVTGAVPGPTFAADATNTYSYTPSSASSIISWESADYTGNAGTPTPYAGTLEETYRDTTTVSSVYGGWQLSTGTTAQNVGLSAPASSISTFGILELAPPVATTYQASVTLGGRGGLTATASTAMTLAATLTSSSKLSGDGFATTAGGMPRQIAATSLTASCFLTMKLDPITMTSSTSVGSVIAVVASADAMVSSSSLTVDGFVSRSLSADLTGSGTPSLVSADSYITPAEGTALVSATVLSAKAQLTFPEDATLTADTSLTADPFATIPVAAELLTASSSVAADSTLSVLVSATMVSSTSVTVDSTRTSSLSASLTSWTTLVVYPEGQTFLGALNTVVVADAYNTAFAAATLTSVSSLLADGFTLESTSATLTSASSVTANVYAVLSVAVSTVSGSSTVADSLPPIALGEAVLTSDSYVVSTPLVQAPGAVLLTASTLFSASINQNTPIFTAPPGPTPIILPTPTTRLMVADTISGRIGWELPFTDVQWSSVLNSIGTMSATLLVEHALDALSDQGVDDPKAALRGIVSGPRRLSYVLTHGEVAFWAGPMQPSVDIADASQNPSLAIKVGASDIASLMQYRLLTQPSSPSGGNYAAADRDVVFQNTTPASAVQQIVQAAIDTSGNRPARALPVYCLAPPDPRGEETFTYLSYDLKDAWTAISDLTSRDDGPDVRFRPWVGVDTDGIAKLWYDLQIGDPYLQASGTPDDQGESAWTFDDETAFVERQSDGVDMTTTLFMTGSGQDRSKLIAEAESSFLTGLGFPALERVDTSHTSFDDPDKLQAAVNGAVQAHELPTETWTVTVNADTDPRLGNYWPGDLARLEVFNHALIEPGIYKRRITGLDNGSTPSQVKITCAVEDAAMAGG